MLRRMLRHITCAVVVALLFSGPAALAQVAPDALSAPLLRESVEAVLGPGRDVTWKAVPLSAQDRAALRPKLKNTLNLPDTLYVGRVQTDEGMRYLIPDTAPSKSETFSYVLYLDDTGAIVDVDVLKYRENYGYEIDYPLFRRQFHGKKKPKALIFQRTIQNISGATISARSLTYAVRDLLTLVRYLGLDALR